MLFRRQDAAEALPHVPAAQAAPVVPADLYERLLPDVRANYDAHDKACLSMRHFWLGHRGGVSGIGEQTDCDGCGHTFYYDGLVWVNWQATDPDEDEVRLCACCATANGYRVRAGQYGLTLAE